MLALNAYNIISLLLPNKRSTGFELITVATEGQRHYRITRENSSVGTIAYYDFLLTLADQEQGAPMIIQIPYISRLFIDNRYPQSEPQELDRELTESNETFKGETFKLLYITAQEINGEILNAEIPSLIDFDRVYTLETADKVIKFVYYRMIGSQAYYSGYLGNLAFPGQYDDDSITIDTSQTVNVLSHEGIDYYIIQVPSTPNAIITNGIPRAALVSDTYTRDDLTYTLTAQSHGIKGKGAYVELRVEHEGKAVSLRGYDLSVEPPGTVTLGQPVLSNDESALRVLFRASDEVDSVDFRLYLALR